VKVENGVVFLNGHVQSKEDSDIAENLTYSVVGVNGIKNNLSVGDSKKFAAKPPQSVQKTAAEPETQPAPTSTGTDATAQQRRISQLLSQAQRQSDMGHYVVARDLYLAVLSIDSNNAQAEEGRKYVHQMIAQQRRSR
jgi:hypothetical protein